MSSITHVFRQGADAIDARLWVRLLWAALLALMAWNFFVYGRQEHEQFTTRHYFSGAEFYYGGYGLEYFDYGDRLVPIQREAAFNFSNFAALQDNNPPPGPGNYQPGYDGAGRMFSSGFVPAVIQRLSFGQLNAHATYLAANAAFWLLAIWVTYLFARGAFEDPFSRLIAPALIASYPVLTLMFQSFKIQYAHSILVLTGLYLAHFVFRRLDLFTATMAFAGLFTMGAFSGGGHVLLLIALLAWLFGGHVFGRGAPVMRDVSLRSSVRLFATAIAGLTIAVVVTSFVRTIEVLPAASPFFDVRRAFVTDTISYLKSWWTGADRSGLTFMGFKGDQFLTQILWMFIKSLWWSNPVILAGGLVAFVVSRAARPFVFTAVVLFLPAHAPEMLVAWVGTYGYGHAPSVFLLTLAFAGMLGEMMARPAGRYWLAKPVAQMAAVMLFAGATAYYLTDRKGHANNYYFSWGVLNKFERIHVYHDGGYARY